MPNVAEVLREHVTLTIDCVDRLYLNAYVPRLQNEGGVVAFLLQRGQKIPSPALFADITAAFKSKLHQLCETHAIPWIEFRKGERKDDVVQPYRAAFTADEGVVLVGVAQERARAWAATKQMHERLVHFTFHGRARRLPLWRRVLHHPRRSRSLIRRTRCTACVSRWWASPWRSGTWGGSAASGWHLAWSGWCQSPQRIVVVCACHRRALG